MVILRNNNTTFYSKIKPVGWCEYDETFSESDPVSSFIRSVSFPDNNDFFNYDELNEVYYIKPSSKCRYFAINFKYNIEGVENISEDSYWISFGNDSVINKLDITYDIVYALNKSVSTDGTIYQNTLLKCSSFIDVEGFNFISINPTYGENNIIADVAIFLNKNKEVIKAITNSDSIFSGNDLIIPIPLDAKFIQINQEKNVFRPIILYRDIISPEILGGYKAKQIKEYIEKDGTTHSHNSLNWTGYIDVEDIESLIIDCRLFNKLPPNAGVLSNYGCIYDKDKNWIGYLYTSSQGRIEFPLPYGAKYIAINSINNLNWLVSNIYFKRKELNLFIPLKSKWSMTKIGFLGDSITESTKVNGVTRSFPQIIGYLLDASESLNYGKGNSCIGGTQNAGVDSFILRYPDMDNDLDMVVVMGGTNDCLYGSLPLGELGDNENNSFYGALSVLMKGLITKYPNSTIVFLTPLHYNDTTMTSGEKHSDEEMNEWSEAIIKSCKKYGLPYIDFRNLCGLNPQHEVIRNKYFYDKWVHLNQLGYFVACERIVKNFELI